MPYLTCKATPAINAGEGVMQCWRLRGFGLPVHGAVSIYSDIIRIWNRLYTATSQYEVECDQGRVRAVGFSSAQRSI